MTRNRGKRVLVIDDEEEVRIAVRHALSRAGYDVEAIADVPAAVRAAVSGDYGLIVLDLRMPGIDGLEIAELLQTRRVTTPVLAVSGHLDDTMVERLHSLGVLHFLSKPFSVLDLIASVEKAVSAQNQ